MLACLLASAFGLCSPAAMAEAPKVSSGAVELADRPLDIPPFNLTMHVPVGSVVETAGVSMDTKVSIKSSDNPKENLWLLQLYASISRDTDLTATKVIDSIVEQRQRSEMVINPKTRRRMKVRQFDRLDDLKIGDQTAARVYLDLPEDTNFPITGYTVFNPAPGTFIIAQFDCPRANLDLARPAIETALATATFRDQQVENSIRAAGLEEGASLLSGLSAEQLESALFKEPLLLRLFKSAPGGSPSDATELGYQKITLRKGQRGEVLPDKPRTSWSPSEREYGYLCQIDARGLVISQTTKEIDRVIDSRSVFFLSSDRTSETCSVVNMIRRGKAVDRYNSTLIRNNQRMTVKTEGPGQEPIVQDYNEMPKGYISRVELMMLPRLVAAANAGADGGSSRPAMFNFYYFDVNSAKLTTRRDEFTPATAGGGWIWNSFPYGADKSRSVETTLSPDGNLIRRFADGVTTEPVEAELLRTLWQNKQLPIEDVKR